MTAPVRTAPARRPSRSSALLSLLALAGTVALLLALLVVVGVLAWQVREHSRVDAARTEGLEAAREAARLLFSYDHRTLERDIAAGLAVTTGGYREEYERTTRESVRPVAEQLDAVVEAVPLEAGVVQAAPGRLVALVYLDQTTTSTRVPEPTVDASRVRMVLREADDRWLVEQVRVL